MARRYLPPAIAPPKGLTGILEGYHYEPGSVLDMSKFPASMVLLNVYDVSDGDLIGRINKVTTANNNILVGGVFHAGVEIYGREWCYGVTEYGRSGVCSVDPRTHPQHNYRCTCILGPTKLSEQEVLVLTARLAQEWPGHEYDLIHHNCISFCGALLPELVPNSRVPGWVDRAMRTAGFIDITSKKVMEETQQTVELVRALSSDLEQKARNLTTAEALELAQQKSQELAGQASEQINVLGENLWEWSEGIRTTAQRGLEEQDIPPEVTEKAELVKRKTQELSDELGEKAQALGASLWQWGQGLQTKSVWGLAGEATTNLHASVSSIVEGGLDSQPSAPPPQQMTTKGLLDEDDDDLLLGSNRCQREDRDNFGLIRSAEEDSLNRGLLAEDDEDEGVDLIGLAAALQDTRSHTAVVEAPAQWSSSAASATPVPVLAAAGSVQSGPSSGPEPIWDLLGAAPEPHVVYGTTEASNGYWEAQGHPPTAPATKAPAAAADPLDGIDLLS